MTLTNLNDILQVLKERRTHCRELLDLSRRQNRVIEANDYSTLLNILGHKQRLLGRLDELKRRHPELGQETGRSSVLTDSTLPAACICGYTRSPSQVCRPLAQQGPLLRLVHRCAARAANLHFHRPGTATGPRIPRRI